MDDSVKENEKPELATSYQGTVDLGLAEVFLIITEGIAKEDEKDTRQVEAYRKNSDGQMVVAGTGYIQKKVKTKQVPVEDTVDELED
jgi:hypothetical protein